MNENEKDIKKKLESIKENLKSYDVQIKDVTLFEFWSKIAILIYIF